MNNLFGRKTVRYQSVQNHKPRNKVAESNELNFQKETEALLEQIEEKQKQILDEKLSGIVSSDDEKIIEKLDEIKSELSEHVHKECIKCYRNIQALFEEFDAKNAGPSDNEKIKGLGSIKVGIGFTIFFVLCNIALLAFHILGYI